MAISSIRVEHDKVFDPLNEPRKGGFRNALERMARLLVGTIGGMAGFVRRTVLVGVLRAFGTVVIASGSGSVNIVINGVTLNRTWATSDIVTASAFVVDINASTDALITKLVLASNLAQTVTFVSCVIGATVEIAGYKFKAVGATTTQLDEFAQITSDTATATALKNAINAMPGLNEVVLATSSAGVVTIRARTAAGPASNVLVCTGSGCTAGGASLVASATVLISATGKGLEGNTNTLAASGTGMTASGARLTGGTTTTYAY